MYDKISLIVDVRRLAWKAANLTDEIHRVNTMGEPPDERVFELLDVSRELNSKSQCLEQLFRGHSPPILGP